MTTIILLFIVLLFIFIFGKVFFRPTNENDNEISIIDSHPYHTNHSNTNKIRVVNDNLLYCNNKKVKIPWYIRGAKGNSIKVEDDELYINGYKYDFLTKSFKKVNDGSI